MLLKRTRNQAQICRPVKPITCADSSRVGYDEKRAERRRNFEGWGQESWSLLYECILEGKTISKKRVGTIIRIVSFGDIFERNYRGIRFAVECIYWKEEEEEGNIRLGEKIRWTKWRKGERKEEKKWKKGRVPGINKSVKFYIIKDFMDCD